MKLIRRFDLETEPSQKVSIPFGAEIFQFGMFNTRPALWALIDDTARGLERTLVIFTDEQEIPQHINKTKHVGSFECKAEVGSYRLHIFED